MDSWQYFIEYKAVRSHVIMAWCGVFLFPAFGLLDYAVIPEWKTFLTVRCVCSLAIVFFLYLHHQYRFSSATIAHFSSFMVLTPLMWMLSQMKTSEDLFIYTLNSSTAFIASAIFLLWRPFHSVLFLLNTFGSFAIFCFFFSTLSFYEIISFGTLMLFTIGLMTQFYINFHYRMLQRDFLTQQKLKKVNLILNDKNAEIMNINHELNEQKEKLEALNDLKNRLFMIISHDFRSPLNSLKGLITLINESHLVTPEDFRKMVKEIKGSVDQTYDLLENLLVWSKSQMQGFTLNVEAINLAVLAEENIQLSAPQAARKQITVINRVDSSHKVLADEDMIRLVIRNLLVNAIKFTQSKGTITMESRRYSSYIQFSIIDTGIGLDHDKLNRLFKSYSRNHQKGTHNERGTGLGLMLCRDFIDLHKGSIWAESNPGNGSCFNFSLEAAPDHQKPLGTSKTASLHSFLK